MKYARILQSVAGTAWAIQPDKGRAVIDFLLAKANGLQSTHEDIANAKSQASEKNSEPYQEQSIGILPISSVIMPRAHDISESSLGPGGAQSSEYLGVAFDRMVSDKKVGAIILDIDSPGGAVAGVMELFEKIYQARERKPIVAIANHFCASAAYWLGCATSEFVMTPSAMVGSVGVYTYHDDITEYLKKEGLERTYISSSTEKVETASEIPMTEKAKKHIQAVVNSEAAQFIRDVARGRGVTDVYVREHFGNGRMFKAEYALTHNMVDRVATLADVISDLSGRLQSSSNRMAHQKFQHAFSTM